VALLAHNNLHETRAADQSETPVDKIKYVQVTPELEYCFLKELGEAFQEPYQFGITSIDDTHANEVAFCHIVAEEHSLPLANARLWNYLMDYSSVWG
jgi:hypothetical protein